MSIERELLGRMTLEEKVAQLVSLPVEDLVDERGEFSEAKAEKLLRHGVGEIARVAGSRLGLRPRQAARLVNRIQKFLVERTRLGIPAIVHEECLSGLMAPSTIMFPMPLALASTWDPELVRRVAEAIRSQALLVGARHCLSPVLDLCLDPRWGRCEETYGEDPYLAAAMGLAYVRGLQGGDLRSGVAATAKHFAGHGWPEGGRNTAPVNAGPRWLRHAHLYPFEAVVKLAGVRTVMAAYHEIDGVPCHASEELLTGVLRREWGFDGVVVSDYWGIRMLVAVHRVAGTCLEAAKLALSAGVDVELPQPECFAQLVDAVRRGEVPESLVDRAVERVLRLKRLLGLFENPYVDESKVPESIDDPSYRQLALEAARKSIVLLKNDGALPLPRSVRRIAVVGELADDPLLMLGDYHYPAHVGAKPDVRVVTVLEGLRGRLGPGVEVVHARSPEEAEAAARSSDVVVAVVGDVSCIFDRKRCTSGEGVDRAELSVPASQREAVARAAGAGRPLVLVVVAGRPMSLDGLDGLANAVLWAWKLGAEGGNAIADVLLGIASPGGRLPVSLPRSAGQLPIYYHRRPSSFGDYVEAPSRPAYPFGYGLSYSQFRYSNLSVEPAEVAGAGKVSVSLEVENAGPYEADEVVQLYVSRPPSDVALPAKELKGFARVSLRPGERRRVTFALPLELLAYYDRRMRLVVTPGEYKVTVGRSSEEAVLEGSFRVLGAVELPERRAFLSEVHVEQVP